jgi:monoamine oxidase
LGGAGAVAETLAVWDFLTPPPAMAAALSLPADSGAGKTVAILGAGVSGLCAAYELDRAGYDCIILEPQRRAGGRSLTLRRGDAFREMGDAPLQVCEYDEGLWLNAGPGRLPHSHVRVLDYCRRFGVALQPYIFASRANLVHSNNLGNGRTIQVRQALYDLQGYVAEIADKCIAKGGLDLPVTGAELEKLHEMLVQFGSLTKTVSSDHAPTYSYANQSGHAGYETMPGGAFEPGKPLSPLKLEEILRSNVWNNWVFRDASFYWQTSLMEPVGGMDMFAKSFLRQPLTRQSGTIDGLIRYGARASAVNVGSDKVTVLYQDNGSERTLQADYCLSTIPMPIFAELTTNLPAQVMTAAANLPPMAAGKVGWQAERFWETNDNIYGGISWTDDSLDQLYMRGKSAVDFNARPVAERLRLAKEQGERLHPGVFAKSVEHGVAIGWNNMEFARLGWIDETDPRFQANAEVLAKPQGRFYFAGDQVTWWTGWQEGAVIAAWSAVQSISQQTRHG